MNGTKSYFKTLARTFPQPAINENRKTSGVQVPSSQFLHLSPKPSITMKVQKPQ